MKEVIINLSIKATVGTNEDAFNFIEEVKEKAKNSLPVSPFALDIKINDVIDSDEVSRIIQEMLRRDVRGY